MFVCLFFFMLFFLFVVFCLFVCFFAVRIFNLETQNSAYPDKTLQNAAFDQGSNCLQSFFARII